MVMAIIGIVELIDPVMKTRVHQNDILTALGLGLMLIPAVGPEVELGIISAEAINIVIDGIKHLPELAQAIWPVGTVNSQDFQIDELTSQLAGTGGISLSLQENLVTLLQLVQGQGAADPSAFLAFTSTGLFSGPSTMSPSVNATSTQQQTILLQAFTTFLTTTVLVNNGWTSLFLPGVQALELHNGSASCPIWAGDDCNDKTNDKGCLSLDPFNQCDNNYWWYSTS